MGKSDYKPINISERNLVILTEEIWKPIKIKHKKTRYEVSTYGRVRNIESGKFMKPHANKKGYLAVVMSLNGKPYKRQIHRLVAKAFVPNPKCRPQVNHIDGNNANNRFDNLEWVTDVQNHKHAINNGLMPSTLTEDEVREICELLMKNELPYDTIGKMYNVSGSLIRCIHHKQRNAWKRITKDYDFPVKKKHPSKSYIRKICRLLKKGIHPTKVAEMCGTYRQYVYRIYQGKMYKPISCGEFGFGDDTIDDSK